LIAAHAAAACFGCEGPWLMEEFVGLDVSDESLDSTAVDESSGANEADNRVVEEAFSEYLVRWNRLVSTTNWEKGRIISEWREKLLEAGAPQPLWSDEAWARRVGKVSGQHVGRLRRTWEQFGEVYTQYVGLYWSHFQAALDWPDAEMWLEGAVQSGWSVNQMRTQRWQALGSPSAEEPRDEIEAEEIDEDADADDPPSDGDGMPDTIHASTEEVFDPDFGDEDDDGDEDDFDSEPSAIESAPLDGDESTRATDPFRPFEKLPRLPDDLAEAFEMFKLAIVAHRMTGWQETTADDVAAALDALKQLALAPV
jgi:hypothetical protein